MSHISFIATDSLLTLPPEQLVLQCHRTFESKHPSNALMPSDSQIYLPSAWCKKTKEVAT